MKLNYLKSPWKTLGYAIRPRRGRFFIMLVTIVLGNVCSFSMPYFLKLIVDTVTSHAAAGGVGGAGVASASAGAITFADLSMPFTFFIVVLVCQEIFFRTGHIIEVYMTPDIFRHITTSLYDGLIKRPTSYFENKFSGDLGRRVEQVGQSVLFFTESLPWEIGWIGLSAVVSAVILGFTNIYLFLTFIGWLAFFVITSIPLLIWNSRTSEKVATAHAKLSGNIVDTLSNIPLVQSFGGVAFEQSQNDMVLSGVVYAERKARWAGAINKLQCGVSLILLAGSLTYVSIFLFTKGEFTVGDFVVVAAIIPSFISVIWNFGDIVIQTTKRYGELADAVAHLREKQEQLMGGDVDEVAHEAFPIEFKDLRFQYPATSAPVFEKFSMHIRQGERVGVVGASGAGKSTLVKLLLRQHEFEAGSVRIGGIPIQDFSLEAFHKLISYVPQDTSLFHRSLFDNIKYAKIHASDGEIFEASKKANADEFIRTFPEGYETKVGERGVKLSGGQRQRIALARAILKNAPILILDEATSSLDSESESFIQGALSKLFKDRTVIAIAHRLSTLKAMDRIVVLEGGIVVEDGNPQELLKKEGSIFKKMWEHQKDGFIS